MSILHTYNSERGFPLLWTGKSDVPVITLENCEKWYSIYLVHPDGTVEKVPVGIIQGILDTTDGLWVDHFYHPHLLLLLAKHYAGETHSVALEVAAGRWLMCDYIAKSAGPEMGYFLSEDN
jgi:hypothetical protein